MPLALLRNLKVMYVRFDLAGVKILSISQAFRNAIRRNNYLNPLATRLYVGAFQPFFSRRLAKKRGLKIKFDDKSIDICESDRQKRVRISTDHAIYLNDIINNFMYFHDAVEDDESGLVDYSRPLLHKVKGFELHPIRFPSLAEPVATTEQYLDFADLHEGSVALDLGAYSGLTSIMFRELCGDSGRVIAVDADADNIVAIHENFELYLAASGREIELMEGAVWVHSDGISFSTEGSMGSSATEIVGNRAGAADLVKSFTLSDIADRCGLDHIDFIKCDIEGGEGVIFQDVPFFTRFQPRIIVEVHPVDGRLTTEAVQRALTPHGYRYHLTEQAGGSFPLMECWVA